MRVRARMRLQAAVLGGCVALAAAGCGEDDFANAPRPAAATALTGVIQPNGITVSPDSEGAGPILLTLSNQTEQTWVVTLEGSRVRERTAPILPQDTATLQKTLEPGTYEVRAGSPKAVETEIAPAQLRITAARPSSNTRVLLP